MEPPSCIKIPITRGVRSVTSTSITRYQLRLGAEREYCGCLHHPGSVDISRYVGIFPFRDTRHGWMPNEGTFDQMYVTAFWQVTCSLLTILAHSSAGRRMLVEERPIGRGGEIARASCDLVVRDAEHSRNCERGRR